MPARIRLHLVIVIVIALLTTNLWAQQPKVLAPHRPIPQRVNEKVDWSKKATQRSMIGGLWMTDANFKSSIYLRNVVETDPITVTPILWLANGTKYTLPKVTLEPAGTAIIDINAGLQSKGISSWATLSGYVELQYAWPWDPLCATIRAVDVAHSLIFTYGLRSTAPLNPLAPRAQAGPQAVQGMWWKEVPDVTGFVTLANVSPVSIQATVQVTDSLARTLADHTVTVSPHGMKRVNLTELPQITDATGGLRITYTGPTDGLIVNGGVVDESVGYSAILPFASRPLQQSDLPPYAKLAGFTGIAELGLMVGAADPMMNFPANTVFKPYSALRNISDSALAVTPTIWWMQGGAAHSARLQQIQLKPKESRSLDVMSMLAMAGLQNFNGNFNLVFDGDVQPGALIPAAGSVDQTKTYVFEVTPRGIGESASKSLQYWSTGNGDDTMITLWNPADEAQDLVLKLFFSGGHYSLPLHFEPRATRTINVSDITMNSAPDAEGNTIPPSIHEGSAKITGSQADNEIIMVAADAGIYNVRKATCGNVCYTCDGYTGWEAQLNPFSVGVNKQYTVTLSAAYDGGSRYNFAGTWTSSNTGVMTVVSSTGITTGVKSGAATVGGPVANLQSAPVYVPDVCTQSGDPCPVGFGGGGQSNGNSFSISSVSPSTFVLGQGGVLTITGSGFSSIGGGPISINSDNPGITASGSVVSGSDTQITGTYQVSGGAPVGAYNIWVTFTQADGGSGAPSNQLPITVVPPPPVVSSISPAQALVGTAVQVTISGSGFAPGATIQAGTSITVSNVSVSSSTTITGTFTIENSSGAGGSWNVTVNSGGQASNSKSFFVQIPSSLQIVGTPSILPTGTSGNYGCTPSANFGIVLDIKYQTLDQQSTPQPIANATMVPHETANLTPPVDQDICPSRVSTCTHTTAADGTWHDAPYGGCLNKAFTTSYTQDITILVGGQGPGYAVRTNNITLKSSGAGHGSITNGSDINRSR